MDWNTAIEQHREMLQRIVALLFALADLADRASAPVAPSSGAKCCSSCRTVRLSRASSSFEEAQASGMPILSCPPRLMTVAAPATPCNLPRAFAR